MSLANLKYKRMPSKGSDVLIIDTVGSDLVIQCIPAGFSFSIVEVRNRAPYIAKPFFFFRLFVRMIQFGLK